MSLHVIHQISCDHCDEPLRQEDRHLQWITFQGPDGLRVDFCDYGHMAAWASARQADYVGALRADLALRVEQSSGNHAEAVANAAEADRLVAELEDVSSSDPEPLAKARRDRDYWHGQVAVIAPHVEAAKAELAAHDARYGGGS